METLKILVFEYITGGGFNNSELPSSLAKEGLMMLNALLDDMSGLDNVDVLLMLDARVCGKVKLADDKIKLIQAGDDYWQHFLQLIPACDAVWPIAPETGGILQRLCAAVERSGRLLLTSPAAAVALTGNKWLTYQHLQQHAIATVTTQLLSDFAYTTGEWMIKPMDGVGCEDSYTIASETEFKQLIQRLDPSCYIVQPHLTGQKISLSCLFKQGKAWLLTVNLQHFEVKNQQYHLTGIEVNFKSKDIKYQLLAEEIAQAMPDLWGYVGIDLIETAGQLLVLEINPRLTSSYAGIKAACGINCAAAVLDLVSGEPKFNAIINQPAYIGLNS